MSYPPVEREKAGAKALRDKAYKKLTEEETKALKGFLATINNVIDLQNRQRDLFKQIIRTFLVKNGHEFTMHEWEEITHQAFKDAGLKY